MSATAGAPYLPFEDGRFRLAMGLMPLAERDWLEIGDDFAALLAEKRTLLETRHAAVFAALPEAAEAAAELLALLLAHLPQRYPALFRHADGALDNLVTGERWAPALSPLHPLDLAGRLVAEDLCLMQADEADVFRLTAASLCAPARWRLADKLGRPLGAIHAPVPGYADRLDRPVGRFFQHLSPGKPVWRLNWGLTTDPARFQPESPPAAAPPPPELVGERVWLRVERQTLRRLPASGAVVFTIRTHLTRLDAAIRTAAAAARLAGAVRSMPPETQGYKQIAALAPTLLAWLAARAAGTGNDPP